MGTFGQCNYDAVARLQAGDCRRSTGCTTTGTGITVRAQQDSSVRIRLAGRVGRRMRMLMWVGTRFNSAIRPGCSGLAAVLMRRPHTSRVAASDRGRLGLVRRGLTTGWATPLAEPLRTATLMILLFTQIILMGVQKDSKTFRGRPVSNASMAPFGNATSRVMVIARATVVSGSAGRTGNRGKTEELPRASGPMAGSENDGRNTHVIQI